MKSIGNAGAERLLSSSFQLSPLPVSFLFFPPFLFDLEPGHGRSSSGPISLNSRGVHEACEMAERNPEVRKGRKRAMRAKTEGETYISEKQERLEFDDDLSCLLHSAAFYSWAFIFRNASSLLLIPPVR